MVREGDSLPTDWKFKKKCYLVHYKVTFLSYAQLTNVSVNKVTKQKSNTQHFAGSLFHTIIITESNLSK